MSEQALVNREANTPEPVRQQSSTPKVAPDVDIFENEAEILLHADMPGVGKDDITLHIDNGTMTLSGTRKLLVTGAVGWRELVDVTFQRSFAVPQSIDVAKVHADFQDGVLRLHLPKSEAAKPKQIPITAA